MNADANHPAMDSPVVEPSAGNIRIDNAMPSHYVGIGASAGGLEAIETFIRNMPPTSGLAFILVQHLSPDYKSMMAELLAKHTRMAVHRIEDGMRVRSDAIYLIPPKKNLTIFHGKLILSDQERSRTGFFLPIDIFFRSLAQDQGERAIGIILSGTGSDGMRGVRAIKESGGMVMVQREETARFDGMPRSAISTGLADFILPPQEMPQQLLAFVKHPEQIRSARSDTILTDEDGLTRIFSLLRERQGIDFTYYKPTTVVRRIERRMTINHINELRDYVKYLESYTQELNILYRELLIGVTSFFRDPDAFEGLAETHLPALLQKVDAPLLRFWVPGCSTGEEAYTLAIICHECMKATGNSPDIKIFATDVDNGAVLFAGNGIYPESIAADLAPRHLSTYFVRRDDSFQIARNIREMVVFAQHNLIKDPPFTNIDLISCRNLLIYFQPVLQRKVLSHFNFSLNPGGLLLLGHSETTGEMADFFDPLDHKWKIYRSRGRNSALGMDLDMPRTHMVSGRLVRPNFLGHHKAMRRHEEERILDRLLECMAEDYVPQTMVVNDQMELLHVLGDTVGILHYPSGRVVNDISRLAVKDLAIPLSTGIQKALKKREAIRYTNIHLRQAGGARVVDMRVKPLPQKKGQEPLVAIFIETADPPSGCAAPVDNTAYDIDQEAAHRIQDLDQELQFTRENLQATIEELETSNEELQATNEELLASNEELQSTNEELQSVNEELHTVNAEHQRKIMELTELTNDISNFMDTAGVATLFLDEDLEIRRFSPQIAVAFRIVENDAGRHLSQVHHRLKNVDLAGIIRQVQENGRRVEKEIQNDDDRWLLMRVTPYRVPPEAIAGIVLTFIDIDDLKRSQRSLKSSRTALKESESKFRLLAEKISDVFWMRTPDLSRTIYVSPAYEKIWGRDIRELETDPKLFLQVIHLDDRNRVADALKTHAKGVWDVEYRIRKSDGKIRWIHDRGFPIHDDDGQLTMMCGFASDITTRKQREEMCMTSLSEFKRSFEKAAVGIALIDEKGRILGSNTALQGMLGIDGDALRSIVFKDLLAADGVDPYLALDGKLKHGKRDFFQLKLRFRRKDDAALPVNLTRIFIGAAAGISNLSIALVERDALTAPEASADDAAP